MSDYVRQWARVYEACGLWVLSWRYIDREAGSDKVPRPWKVGVVPRMGATDVDSRWHDHPDDNVGVVTGAVSGVVVVDCDDQAAVQWALAHLPPTPWQVASGREGGGLHLGYRYPRLFYPNGVRLTTCAKIGCKHKNVKDKADPVHRSCHEQGALCALDVRADGGYVAMPPSVHESGREYEWLCDQDDFAALLRDLPVFDPTWLPGFKKTTVFDQSTSLLDWASDDQGGDVETARQWLERQPGAVDGGGGRNHTFNVCAMLLRDYALTAKQAWPLLLRWNERCRGPWTESALRSKMEDAYLKGSAQVGIRKHTFSVTSVLEEALTTKRSLLLGEVRASVAQAPQPASTQEKPVEPVLSVLKPPPSGSPDETDDDFVRRVIADSTVNSGVAFRRENMLRVARLYLDRPDLFQVLKNDLRGYCDLRDFARLVKATARELQYGPQATFSLTSDARTEIVVSGDEKQARDQILVVLEQCPGVFVTGGKLSYLGRTGSMVELQGGPLKNLLVDHCSILQVSNDPSAPGKRPTTLPSGVLTMLEGLLPDQLDRFREVKQVARAPYFTPDGRLICTPGYDPGTKVLLGECPETDPDMFESTQHALGALWSVFHQFPFQDEAEWQNYLGALLVPMLRPAYYGPTLWLLIEANLPSSGKTFLAEAVQMLYGHRSKKRTLPGEEVEIEKSMLMLLSEARPIEIFDNVKHVVDSATIELVATTSDDYEGRVLGKTEGRSVPVLQLFIVTAQNATMCPDAARRFMRCRLQKRSAVTANAKTRPQFVIKGFLQYVKENRAWMLSALARLARDWFAAGKPVADTVPMVATFEAFCETVGGVMHHAGCVQWLSNYDEARSGFAVNDEWGIFFRVWWKTFAAGLQSDVSLYELAQHHSLLAFVTARQSDRSSKMAMFRKRLNDHRDWTDGERRVLLEPAADGNKMLYRLEPVTAGAPS